MTSLLIATQTPADFEKAPQAAEEELDVLFAKHLEKQQKKNKDRSPQVYEGLAVGAGGSEGAEQGDVYVQFLGDNRPSQRNYDLIELPTGVDHAVDDATHAGHILEAAPGVSLYRTMHPTTKMFAYVTEGPLVLRHAPHEGEEVHQHKTLIYRDPGWYVVRVQRSLLGVRAARAD